MAIPLAGGIASGALAWFLRVMVFSVIADFVIKTMVSVGLVYVAYNMGDWSLNSLYSMAQNSTSSVPQDTLQIIVRMGFNEVFDIIFTAIAVRIALDLMKNTKVLRFINFGA